MCTVIIGSGPQMGASLAKRFSRGGGKVAVVSRSHPRDAAGADDVNIAAFQGDASSPESVDEAIDAIRSWSGQIETLIYNAADMASEDARDLTAAQLQATLNTNLLGAIHSVQRVLPGMLANGRGTILITGGGLALNPVAGWSSLAIGKAALRAYVHSLHKSVAGDGVHVATVTICGIVESGTAFDPDLIADRYWELHMQPAGSFEAEIVYQPDGSDRNYNEAS